eukprot:4101160-Prymnesium_polylepis.2
MSPVKEETSRMRWLRNEYTCGISSISTSRSHWMLLPAIGQACSTQCFFISRSISSCAASLVTVEATISEKRPLPGVSASGGNAPPGSRSRN